VSTPATHRQDTSWQTRLISDEQRTRDFIPPGLRMLHDAVATRARKSHAQALLLTGSTARGTRTAISDLDYHLIGEPIVTDDLSGELDLHVVSATLLNTRLHEGDDFTQWSLRFGCVVFDEGIVRDSVGLIDEQRLWPDPARKRQQARKSVGIARAIVASGDHDAAIEQVRTALTLTARWRLLADKRFPLSRAELPTQLEGLGYVTLATGLATTIHGLPPMHQLALYVDTASALLDRKPGSIEGSTRSHAA
jgi:hypothetical protein